MTIEQTNNNTSSSQRELQMQFEYITSQIEQAQRQLVETRAVLGEIQETTLAIAELEAKPKSTIVAIGSNSFVNAKIDANKVITPVGANVFTLKTPAEARKTLEKQASKVLTVISNIERALSQLYQLQRRIVEQAEKQQSEETQ